VTPKFEIEITSQAWITDQPSSKLDDLCSHGNLRLVIAGCVVAPGDGDDDYTLSTSALALSGRSSRITSPDRAWTISSCTAASC